MIKLRHKYRIKRSMRAYITNFIEQISFYILYVFIYFIYIYIYKSSRLRSRNFNWQLWWKMSGYIMKICAGKYDGNVPEFLVQARSTKTGEYIFVLNHVVVFFSANLILQCWNFSQGRDRISAIMRDANYGGPFKFVFEINFFEKFRADKLNFEHSERENANSRPPVRAASGPRQHRWAPPVRPSVLGPGRAVVPWDPEMCFWGGRVVLLMLHHRKVFFGGILWMLKHRNIGTV